jgi:hypothetical protein
MNKQYCITFTDTIIFNIEEIKIQIRYRELQ